MRPRCQLWLLLLLGLALVQVYASTEEVQRKQISQKDELKEEEEAAGSRLGELEVGRPPAAGFKLPQTQAMIDDRFDAGSMSGAPSKDWLLGRDNNNNNNNLEDSHRPRRSPKDFNKPANQPPETGNQRPSDRQVGEAGKLEEPALKCRVEKDLYLDFEEYKHYSCAICYNNMAESVFVRKLTFLRQSRIWLYDELTDTRVLPNDTSFLLDTFKKESTANMWLYCCQQAVDCCRKNWLHYLSPALAAKSGSSPQTLVDPPERDFCPATWDGLECWPNTPAGHTLEHPCPDHVYFLSFVPVCSGSVSKRCFSNGSWFIRNNHEWSNFTNCAPLPLYETRMLIGSIWNIVSALVVAPSLLIFSRLPNRGGSKRVQILQNLLLWVLIYYLFEATHKIGVITKVFRLGSEPNDPLSSHNHRLRPQHSSLFTSNTRQSPTTLMIGQHIGASAGDAGISWPRPPTTGSRQKRSDLEEKEEQERSLRVNMVDLDHKEELLCNLNSNCTLLAHPNQSQVPQTSGVLSRDASVESVIKFKTSFGVSPVNSRSRFARESVEKLRENISSTSLYQVADVIPTYSNLTSSPQLQRLTSTPANNQRQRAVRQSTLITLACWTVSLGVRITRQLGYAWMFAGAIYLCSVLHFAPAEPPPLFIRWLMILTNVIPLTIGLVYLIVRSIYEASPLVLLFKLPYYYAINDSSTVEYLKESQADCWMFRSNHDAIEQITEFPNLVLVILNSGLFIVTLTIMCRISRPGSTRQEMSLGHYFKAAGTLVLLYGAHYTLLAGLPNVDKKRSQDANGCIKAQIGYYAFQFVDSIQGILVSYVFCYRTQEGREIISKWWSNWGSNKYQWLRLSSGRRKPTRVSRDYISPASQDKNISTRSTANEKEASFMDSGTKIEVCDF